MVGTVPRRGIGCPLRERHHPGRADLGDHGGMPPEDPRTPDRSPGSSPGSPQDSSPDRELRRDIRMVTSILGETLARTEGDELLALVEDVRAHAKEDRLDQLPEVDLATITRPG